MKDKKQPDNYWEPLARMLEIMPRFQREVAATRDQLGISQSGILNDHRADWYQSFFTNPDTDTGRRYGFMPGHDLLPPNQQILDALDGLVASFNLDSRWLNSLFQHLFSPGSPLEPPFWRSAYPEARLNDVRLPKEQQRVTALTIRVYKDTSVQDVVDVWSEVEAYQAYMDARLPSRRDKTLDETVQRYRRLCELKNGGLTYRQIAETYPELRFNTAEDAQDFKRQIEKRFQPTKPGTLRNVPDLWWHKP